MFLVFKQVILNHVLVKDDQQTYVIRNDGEELKAVCPCVSFCWGVVQKEVKPGQDASGMLSNGKRALP